MKRCDWDGRQIPNADTRDVLPASVVTDPFRYLPPSTTFTDEMAALADRYQSHDIDWRYYPAFQAAAFLRPLSTAQHEKRRAKFAELNEQVERMGFQLPASVFELMETDDYIDRLHHNTIWLQLPDELWRLPADPEKLMFLVFSEGQGCCHWHLLLAPDHTHCMVCCEAAFGLPSVWPKNNIPDFGKFEIRQCATCLNEWLFYFFQDSAEQDRHYVKRLADYFARRE